MARELYDVIINFQCVQDLLFLRIFIQQFRVIRDHLNSKCLTSIIVFDIQVR